MLNLLFGSLYQFLILVIYDKAFNCGRLLSIGERESGRGDSNFTSPQIPVCFVVSIAFEVCNDQIFSNISRSCTVSGSYSCIFYYSSFIVFIGSPIILVGNYLVLDRIAFSGIISFEFGKYLRFTGICKTILAIHT